MARMHYKNTATDVKRLLGRKFKHPEVQQELQQLAFTCVELSSGDVGIVLTYNDEPVTFSCEQVVAMILNKMQHIAAAANEGVTPAYCVLSCPGYYTDGQRRALLNASKIAGLNCLRLMNEHTAIALAYGIYKSARNLFHETVPQHVMFIDVGHASYTVAVVAFVQGRLTVKSVAFDRFLGGRDFDLAIAKDAAAKFADKYKVANPLENNPKARMKLLAACEKAKKNLSPYGVSATQLNIECLAEDRDYNAQVTLEEFEALIAPLLERLNGPVEQALADAGLKATDLTNVEIVGGGTRVTSVKRHLAEVLGLDKEQQNYGLSSTLNADESVARGCALNCAILSPMFKVKEFSVTDRVHLPVRVSWDGSASAAADGADDDEDANMEATAADDSSLVIFSRKDEYPKTKRITFRRDKSFSIDAAYDESAKAYLPLDYAMDIGKYTILGMPAQEAGAEVPKIRVNVQQDMNGLFSVASSQLMQEIKEEEKPADTEGDEKMDEKKEDESKKDDKKEDKAAGPKKKRFRKVELIVQSQVGGLSTTDVSSATEQELKMAQQDRVIEDTFNKRNELESFVYEMRNQITDKLAAFITSDEKSNLEKKLVDTEDWLYTDEGFDSTKSVYQQKLDDMRKLSSPVEFRQTESTERGVAQAELTAVLEEYKRMVNSGDDMYSHWTEDEKTKLRQTCVDAETWLFDGLAKQADVSPMDAPVLTSASIRSKIVAVRAVALPITTKPKPLPKVETPPAPETSEQAAPSEEKDATEKMDLD
uniref:Heat shock protein 70 n=1 Tax=Peronospora matthiolae TaxID=2874970 RepID=A0AAV1VB66_9STRA